MTDQPTAYTLYAAFAGANGDRRIPDAERTDAAAAAGDDGHSRARRLHGERLPA
jgi:hypothetical protein